ncbi:hypothetical protein [Acidithiobacillus sp.]|uniref:hypothetical protein n=1 Tax=Acidithiobacillus sp. TaxID=1872118 RepID=UPI0025C71DA5|nr:hypothetical protein [Acidithiobacillus sp.]MCK9189189.1 hypothetical protein [Acidithiobacillus sp.]MCK9359631.1 hypothetical protein [Acidithiobacillus sp.]
MRFLMIRLADISADTDLSMSWTATLVSDDSRGHPKAWRWDGLPLKEAAPPDGHRENSWVAIPQGHAQHFPTTTPSVWAEGVVDSGGIPVDTFFEAVS